MRPKADDAALREKQREYQARRAELYRDHPAAERFQARKTALLKGMLLACLALTAGKAAVLRSMNGASPAVLIAGAVLGFGINAIFLAGGMHYKRRMAFALYLWVGGNAVRYVQALAQQGAGSLGEVAEIYGLLFEYFPLAGALELLNGGFLLFVLGTALWLTAPPENRRLAAEAEGLEEQWKAFLVSENAKTPK